jgi:hypothetical protein
VDLAVDVLRVRQIPSQDQFDLAGRLRAVNRFGYARKLYKRLWEGDGKTALNVTIPRLGQDLALSTYKDPDLPAAVRFAKALEILDALAFAFKAHLLLFDPLFVKQGRLGRFVKTPRPERDNPNDCERPAAVKTSSP